MLPKDLLEKILKSIAPTREERLALARERSRVFNERAERDLKAQQMTPELLAKRCTL